MLSPIYAMSKIIKACIINDSHEDDIDSKILATLPHYLQDNQDELWTGSRNLPEEIYVLVVLRRIQQCAISPFSIHKLGDALFAHPGDVNVTTARSVKIRKIWADLRLGIWGSEVDTYVSQNMIIAAESAIMDMFDLVFIDYEDASEVDTLTVLHQDFYDRNVDMLGEIGLSGDDADRFLARATYCWNHMYNVLELYMVQQTK